MKFRNKFRISRFMQSAKSSIMVWAKGSVPTYITQDIMQRLHNGEKEITLPMCGDIAHKSITDYLNEYHKQKSHWKLDFLSIAFDFTSAKIKQKLGWFSDIDIEVLDISDTDKRIIIKMK